jgi:biopolymer transport protein ExbD
VNFRHSAKRRIDATVEIMPLIDVVFLLLIFFMITTTFTQDSKEQSIPINLPSGVAGQAAGEGDSVILSVTPEGEVVFEGDLVPEGETLETRLDNLYKTNPDVDILLRGDSEVSHGEIVRILDTIKSKGFKRANLVITRPD